LCGKFVKKQQKSVAQSSSEFPLFSCQIPNTSHRMSIIRMSRGESLCAHACASAIGTGFMDFARMLDYWKDETRSRDVGVHVKSVKRDNLKTV
jgi:hypothetical protein